MDEDLTGDCLSIPCLELSRYSKLYPRYQCTQAHAAFVAVQPINMTTFVFMRAAAIRVAGTFRLSYDKNTSDITLSQVPSFCRSQRHVYTESSQERRHALISCAPSRQVNSLGIKADISLTRYLANKRTSSATSFGCCGKCVYRRVAPFVVQPRGSKTELVEEEDTHALQAVMICCAS